MTNFNVSIHLYTGDVYKVRTPSIFPKNIAEKLMMHSRSTDFMAAGLDLTALDLVYTFTSPDGFEYSESVAARAKDKVELIQTLEEKLRFEKVSNVAIAWSKLVVFKNGDNIVLKTVFTSFMQFNAYKDNVAANKAFVKLGVSLYDCYEKECGDSLTFALVLKSSSPIIMQTPAKQAAYCHSTMAQMILSVDVGEDVITYVRSTTWSPHETKIRYITAFTTLRKGSLGALCEVHDEEKAQWQECVSLCRAQLEKVCRCIRASTDHNEATRRLVIDQVLIILTDYLQVQFSVEEQQNTAGIAAPYTGWGKLDYALDPAIVVEVCSEAPPHNADELPSMNKNVQTTVKETKRVRFSGDAELVDESEVGDEESVDDDDCEDDDDSNAVDALSAVLETMKTTYPSKIVSFVQKKLSHWRSLEAKQYCNDDAAAQLLSQMHDSLVRPESTHSVVLGVLSNGHDWHYFSLSRPSHAGGKPKVGYHGFAQMRVLRQPVLTKGAQRRPSCREETDFNVERESVELVMRSLRHLLTRGPI